MILLDRDKLMSAYSTMSVTRSKAREVWLQTKIKKNPHKELKYRKRVIGLTDKKLTKFMDEYLEDRLFNCNIVADDYVPSNNFEFFNCC